MYLLSDLLEPLLNRPQPGCYRVFPLLQGAVQLQAVGCEGQNRPLGGFNCKGKRSLGKRKQPGRASNQLKGRKNKTKSATNGKRSAPFLRDWRKRRQESSRSRNASSCALKHRTTQEMITKPRTQTEVSKSRSYTAVCKCQMSFSVGQSKSIITSHPLTRQRRFSAGGLLKARGQCPSLAAALPNRC